MPRRRSNYSVSNGTPDHLLNQGGHAAFRKMAVAYSLYRHAHIAPLQVVACTLIIAFDQPRKRGRNVQEPIQQVKSRGVSLNGLDEVFDVDTTVIEGSDKGDSTLRSAPGQGLTIKQASEHYGLAVPTIRLKIKTGDIPALKMNGPKGPEWRVFPNGMPASYDKVDSTVHAFDSQPDSSVIEGFYKADRTVAEGFHQANINLAALIKANHELTSKLEAVTYRNGYLEAQIENERQQVKLLTDQLHKPEHPSWWARFCSWFIGR